MYETNDPASRNMRVHKTRRLYERCYLYKGQLFQKDLMLKKDDTVRCLSKSQVLEEHPSHSILLCTSIIHTLYTHSLTHSLTNSHSLTLTLTLTERKRQRDRETEKEREKGTRPATPATYINRAQLTPTWRRYGIVVQARS